MYAVILVLHVIVCLLLIAVILVQGGRGGMAEALGGSGSQSLFGGGANVVMTKVTATGAVVFMLTCVSLALLSTHRGRSVIERMNAMPDASTGLPMPPVPDGEFPAAPAVAEPVEPSTPPVEPVNLPTP